MLVLIQMLELTQLLRRIQPLETIQLLCLIQLLGPILLQTAPGPKVLPLTEQDSRASEKRLRAAQLSRGTDQLQWNQPAPSSTTGQR